MAAKTPVSKGTAGWLDPSLCTVDREAADATPVPNTIPGQATYYFSDIDDADTYTITTWRGAQPHVHFIPSSADAVTAVGSLSGSTLTILFQTGAANQTGYLVLTPRVTVY